MDWTIARGSSRSLAAETALNVASPSNCLVTKMFCPIYQAARLVVPCDWTRTLAPPLSRAQIFVLLPMLDSTDLWTAEDNMSAIEVKKAFLSPPSHLWHWQKKFSSTASSSATAAACLCWWYVFGFVPICVRKISTMHKSGVRRLYGGMALSWPLLLSSQVCRQDSATSAED